MISCHNPARTVLCCWGHTYSRCRKPDQGKLQLQLQLQFQFEWKFTDAIRREDIKAFWVIWFDDRDQKGTGKPCSGRTWYVFPQFCRPDYPVLRKFKRFDTALKELLCSSSLPSTKNALGSDGNRILNYFFVLRMLPTRSRLLKHPGREAADVRSPQLATRTPLALFSHPVHFDCFQRQHGRIRPVEI